VLFLSFLFLKSSNPWADDFSETTPPGQLEAFVFRKRCIACDKPPPPQLTVTESGLVPD